MNLPMIMDNNRITYLLQRYTNSQATSAEIDEMLLLLRQSKDDKELESFMQELAMQPANEPATAVVNWDHMWENIRRDTQPQAIVRKLSRKWIAAAALLLLMLGAATYWLWQPVTKQPTVIVTKEPVRDVAPPAISKAVLTLDNGRQVILDSAGKGLLAVQGNVNIVKRSDELVAYQGNEAGSTGYNTLTIPKGSRPMALLLADGSRVWLNVASSIRYPVAFRDLHAGWILTAKPILK